MLSRIIELFVKYWKSEDSVEHITSGQVDAVVPISYATKPDELLLATEENLWTSIEFQRRLRRAPIVLSSCSYVFKGAERIENRLKCRILQTAEANYIFAKSMINTINEAENIKAVLHESGIKPKSILVVTGELHSRSARLVYRKLFPESHVFVTCIPYQLEIQLDHPVPVQRVMWKWAIANVARQVALRVLPWGALREMRHNT